MDYNVTSDGYTVRDIEQNWAAEYAKRLTEQEAKTRSEADTNLNTKIGNLAVSVNSGEAIGDGVITTDKIDDRAVTSDKLDLLSVKGEHIREQNITTGKIHDLNVTTVKLADRAVTTDKLADRVVTKDKLARWAVTNEKIEPGAVTSDKLFDVFASIVEVRNGVADNKAVTPYTLKHGIGDIIPMSVINGDLFLENVNVETIGADVTSISHNPVKDAGLRTYSITPVQVGTWIDGTPIYRKAFSLAYSYIQGKTGTSGDVTLQDIGIYLDTDEAIHILNERCYAHCNGQTMPDVVPAYDVRVIDGFLFAVDMLHQDVLRYLDQDDGTVYGYIEYFIKQIETVE